MKLRQFMSFPIEKILLKNCAKDVSWKLVQVLLRLQRITLNIYWKIKFLRKSWLAKLSKYIKINMLTPSGYFQNNNKLDIKFNCKSILSTFLQLLFWLLACAYLGVQNKQMSDKNCIVSILFSNFNNLSKIHNTCF